MQGLQRLVIKSLAFLSLATVEKTTNIIVPGVDSCIVVKVGCSMAIVNSWDNKGFFKTTAYRRMTRTCHVSVAGSTAVTRRS